MKSLKVKSFPKHLKEAIEVDLTPLELNGNIRVEDVNGSTNVTLQAARIGTTYFQQNLKTGVRTISGKTGFDYTTGQTWNSF